MRNSIRRILSAAAAGAVLIFSAVPAVSVYAVDDTMQMEDEALTDGTFTYELVDGTYTIVSCDTKAVVSEVPELRNGYTITAIGEKAFTGCTLIKELKLPDSVKTIGDNAFAGCTSLRKVELPKNLKSLPLGAFLNCTRLEEAVMPEGLISIGNYAFYGCSALGSIKLPSTVSEIGAMALAECGALENIDASGNKSFTVKDGILSDKAGTKLIRASAALTGSVYVENGVKEICPGAFSSCAGITDVFIPASVNEIKEDAFGYCSALKNVGFSEGLTVVGDIAFKFCTALESVEFPTTLRTIGEGAFFQCRSLKSVIIPADTESIGEGAFVACPELKQIGIPKSVTTLGEHAAGFNISESGEDYVKNDGFRMSVYSGSAGLSYAKSNKLTYDVVDRDLKKVAFAAVAVGLIAAVIVFAAVLMKRGRKSAAPEVRRADKEAAEKAEEESYEKIVKD